MPQLLKILEGNIFRKKKSATYEKESRAHFQVYVDQQTTQIWISLLLYSSRDILQKSR